uniref:UL38 capsid assembly and DNA maturation protein VP19 n=1 Tax=Meleagrid herpesvirus 1 TaxID=37108 RepID=Q9E1F6_MEHV1|nr:UL38 capsid assembly and DNA maturation protein VP19 [Meleagrid alphaherpesvirus 1]
MALPERSRNTKTASRTSEMKYYSAHSNRPYELHSLMRSIGKNIRTSVGGRINLGYMNVGDRSSVNDLNVLWTADTLGMYKMDRTPAFKDSTAKTTAIIAQSIRSNSEIREWGGDRAVITRQVTLTDFCFPDAEFPGSILLSMRHPLDINSEALYATPGGRDPRALETAWYDLSELAAVSVNRRDGGGVRPSLVSLFFLVASRAGDYSDKNGAEAVRAHVISNYGRRRMEERLDRFGICQMAMLRSHVFPHRFFQLLGGMISWVSQREIASITAVMRGSQESIKTEQTTLPRSSVYVPACAYIDLDSSIRVIYEDKSASLIYLVFVYTQRLGRESIRVYVMRSRLGEGTVQECLGYLYSELRANNTIHGTDGTLTPHGANVNTEFPLNSSFETQSQPAKFTRKVEKAEWKVDLRGRPTQESCMYAAYCRMGYLDGSCTPLKKSERYGSVDVPIVWLPGMHWDVGDWTECYC